MQERQWYTQVVKPRRKPKNTGGKDREGSEESEGTSSRFKRTYTEKNVMLVNVGRKNVRWSIKVRCI